MARALILALSLLLSASLLSGCCNCDAEDATTESVSTDSPAPSETTEEDDDDEPTKRTGLKKYGDKTKDKKVSGKLDVDGDPVEGSALNTFFPAAKVDGHERVFTKEKSGFAEAVLKKDGNQVAKLTINDTAGNPKARAKFDSPDDKVSGHPLVKFGKKGSSALIAGRYQVKVTSKVLDHKDRTKWISRFDLSGLAGLK